jgi:hypothetical protein
MNLVKWIPLSSPTAPAYFAEVISQWKATPIYHFLNEKYPIFIFLKEIIHFQNFQTIHEKTNKLNVLTFFSDANHYLL